MSTIVFFLKKKPLCMFHSFLADGNLDFQTLWADPFFRSHVASSNWVTYTSYEVIKKTKRQGPIPRGHPATFSWIPHTAESKQLHSYIKKKLQTFLTVKLHSSPLHSPSPPFLCPFHSHPLRIIDIPTTTHTIPKMAFSILILLYLLQSFNFASEFKFWFFWP